MHQVAKWPNQSNDRLDDSGKDRKPETRYEP